MSKLHGIITYCSVFLPKRKFCQYYQKTPWKQILNLSHSDLFYMETRVFLKYLVRCCSIPKNVWEIFQLFLGDNLLIPQSVKDFMAYFTEVIQWGQTIIFHYISWDKGCARVIVSMSYQVTICGAGTCPATNNQEEFYGLRCHFSCRHHLY